MIRFLLTTSPFLHRFRWLTPILKGITRTFYLTPFCWKHRNLKFSWTCLLESRARSRICKKRGPRVETGRKLADIAPKLAEFAWFSCQKGRGAGADRPYLDPPLESRPTLKNLTIISQNAWVLDSSIWSWHLAGNDGPSIVSLFLSTENNKLFYNTNSSKSFIERAKHLNCWVPVPYKNTTWVHSCTVMLTGWFKSKNMKQIKSAW